ncbi:hypothetical protein BJB45_01000 [Halomonas huangheensis]|uniref:Uncharacterized protein n=2 Tax=Halomonas huangheensis TaxID=1178482 RepID=W1N3I9_9GAMM|nr:hypothetical protein AR456_02555 [Halomonas huangheensis]ERL49726.1 hypothetical protein BJB45_01000 [Halomonas huangheensis]
MGLTSWESRYQLPNALQTSVCDWPELESPESARPRAGAENLHALLEDAAQAVPPPQVEPSSQPSSHGDAAPAEPAVQVGRGQRKARALLGDIAPEEPSERGGEVADPDSALQEVASEASEPLRFDCQVCCLDGRWLLLMAQPQPLDAVGQRLLLNILRAAGVQVEQSPSFESLRWPLEEGLPVHQPRAEARQGLKAFVAGRRRRGWEPERLLIFGDDEALQTVVDVDDNGHSQTLEMPVWQGPGLLELLSGSGAKRALWPHAVEWRRQWLGEVGQGD